MGNPCKLYDNLPERSERGKFDDNELSEITNKTILQQNLLQTLADDALPEVNARMNQHAKVKGMLDNLFVQNVGNIVSIAPNQKDHLASFLARYFDQKTRLLGLDPYTFTTPGEVKLNLIESARVADGILDTQGKMFALKNLHELQAQIKSFMKQGGLKHNISEIMYETLESGLTNKNQALYGNTQNVQKFLAGRYNKYIDFMKSIGFSDDQIGSIVDVAGKASASFEAMRLAAETFGIKIPELFNIGFVPRELTFDASIRVADHTKKVDSLFQGLSEKPFTAKTQHTKSRSLWYFIPEDEAFVMKLTGLNQNELNDLLADGIQWRNYLGNNFSDDQLDLLVDSGVMSKLPMTSRETFDYMVKTYELPYKELNEMFLIDPVRAVDAYSTSLAKSIRTGAMLKTVAQEGMNKGWAVTEAQVKANPDLSRFVKLGSIDHPILQEMLPGMSGNLYVHPIVADQLLGIVRLSTSPANMGNLAKTWSTITTLFREMAITGANVGYLGRQFLTNAVSLFSLGGNISYVLSSFYDITRAYKYGLDAFDNTKPYRYIDGKELTKREFFSRFFINRGVPYTPLVPGERKLNFNFRSLSPVQAKRMLNYLWTYANDTPYGSPLEKGWRGTQYVGNVFREVMHDTYKVWGGAASFIDMAFRLAAYKSVSQLPSGNINQLLDHTTQLFLGWSVKKFDTMHEINKMVDDYLPMFDAVGETTSFVSRFVKPFATWAMVNLPMQLRHMMRYPAKFVAYNKLISMITDEALQGDTISEGEMNQYDLDEYPIVLKRDPVNKQTIILTPTNYDPLLGTVTYLKQNKEKFEAILGWYPDNTQKQRAAIKAELGLEKPLWVTELSKMFGETYAAPFVELFTGVDLQTGRAVKEKPWQDNTYLGMKMPSSVEAVLSMFPVVDALDRSNPFGVFGTTEVKDGRGNTIRPETMSIFNAPRDKADTTLNDPVSRDWGFNMLRMFGMRVRAVDGLKNMGYNYEDTEKLTTELRSAIKRNQIELTVKRQSLSAEEYQGRIKKLEHMIDVWLQFEWDLGRIRKWMVDNKVPRQEVLQELEKRKILTNQLPMPGGDFVQEKLREAAEMRKKLNKK